MKKWFKPAFIILACLEFTFCAWFGLRIYKQKNKNVLGASSVSKIDKTANSYNYTNTLNYYYEPIAHQTEKDTNKGLTKDVVWTYNADTLNDRYEYEHTKPSDTYRVIALGDSFTFGEHVNVADSWPEILEDILKTQKICPNYSNYEVINLGVRGFDIQHEVHRFRLRGQKYNPDLVIWMLISNDFDEINEIVRPKIDLLYKQMEGNIIAESSEIYVKASMQASKEFLEQYDQDRRYNLLNDFFTEFNSLYKKHLLFATYQFVNDSDKKLMWYWKNRRPLTYIIDSLPNIYSRTDLHTASVDDGHPNEKGHTVIAEQIFQYIKDNHLILCN